MEDYIGKICPFCKTEIKEGEEVKVCPSCGIPHHAACWAENKGCTTFGCSEQHYEEQHTNPTDVCVNCGAPLGDGQEFCPKCGTPKGGVKKRICSKCGAELEEGHEFCPKCGQRYDIKLDAGVNSAISQFNAGVTKSNKKKKKLPLIIGITAGVLVVLGVLAFVLLRPKKPTSISVSRTSVTMEREETVTLNYNVSPENASKYTVSWETSDSSVATVSDGVITAKGSGKCTITAKTDNGKESICDVTVQMPEKERKVVGTWKVVSILDIDKKDRSNSSSWGWRLYLYDDNTGRLDYDSDSDLQFVWYYDHTDNDGDYAYGTSATDTHFFYIIKNREIWFYISNLCLTCE